MFCDVAGCSASFDAFAGCFGEAPLFSAKSVADFAVGAGFYFAEIADAADLFTICFFVPVICVFDEDLVFFDKHCRDVRADAVGFWFHAVEDFEVFDVFFCYCHMYG